MRTAIIPAGLFLALVAFPALAADDCVNPGDQSTMNICAGKAFRAADAELNTLYQQIEARLKDNPDAIKLLVSAQRAWVAYRDAECRFANSRSADGSAYPMLTSLCRAGMTRKRNEDFKAYLSCEEGDLSCPVPAAN